MVRGRKYRGGTPSGERAALRCARRIRLMRTIGRHAPGGVLLPFIFFVARVERSETRDTVRLERSIPGFARATDAEHDRAENRSHRRFRRDAMVLGGVFDCLLCMISVRKPVATFRDHGVSKACLGRASRREKDTLFVIAGLDPAIHAVAKLIQIIRVVSFASL